MLCALRRAEAHALGTLSHSDACLCPGILPEDSAHVTWRTHKHRLAVRYDIALQIRGSENVYMQRAMRKMLSPIQEACRKTWLGLGECHRLEAHSGPML